MRLSIVWLVLMTATRLAQAQTQPRPKFDVSVVKLMDLRLGASGLQAQYQTPLWVFSCKDGHFVSTGPPLKNVIWGGLPGALAILGSGLGRYGRNAILHRG